MQTEVISNLHQQLPEAEHRRFYYQQNLVAAGDSSPLLQDTKGPPYWGVLYHNLARVPGVLQEHMSIFV